VFPDTYTYPAPPRYRESSYYDLVLNNRSVPRVVDPLEEIDLIYDKASHSLKAINGAKIMELGREPIIAWNSGYHSFPSVDKEIKLTIPKRGNAFKIPSLQTNIPLAITPPRPPRPAPLETSMQSITKINSFGGEMQPKTFRQLSFIDGVSPSSSRSFGRASFLKPRLPGKEVLSPQEKSIEKQGPLFRSRYLSARNTQGTKRMQLSPVVREGVGSGGGGAQSPIAQALSTCKGWSNADFKCPTLTDPIPIETFPSKPDGTSTLMLWDVLTPYLKSQKNVFGTCGTHASVQFIETLYNRYGIDLGTERVITVDNEQILVPWPRISFSISGLLTQLYTEMGTRDGDVPDGVDVSGTYWGSGRYEEKYPVFLDAYWPSRETLWTAWADNWTDTDLSQDARDMLKYCRRSTYNTDKNNWNPRFWRSGFCLGQGHAPAGVYWNYSRGRLYTNSRPDSLTALPWALGTVQLPIVFENVSDSNLSDSMKLKRIINDLDSGLPMLLGFSSGAKASIPDGNGGNYTARSGPTWFVPRELGGNLRQDLRNTLQVAGGHAVLIVGYSIDGNINGSYNPYESYFIIQNNWGKDSGYKSFYFMNFAAFDLLSTGLKSFRIDKRCASVACVDQ